ncbi:MAG: hypothetical protein HEQ32_09415 [Vampirovibrio sp.]
MGLGAFQSSQTSNDYWLNTSPAFTQRFALDIERGNTTNNLSVNQLLQEAGALESYGIVPATAILSGGDPKALGAFDRSAFSNNPRDLSSTQLSAMGQALYGVVNAPLFAQRPFQPSGYPTLGDVYSAPFNLAPNVSNGIPTGLQSQWFV